MVSDPSNYVAIYARESNPSVKSALEAQVITCTRYARENNLIIYDVYKEFITGTKHFSRRVEFKRLIEDAKKGLFKKIIVTKRDRLTRDFNNHLELRKLFKGMNIEILYSNDVQLREDRDYAANFIENMIMAIAELEPQNIKDRIHTGQQIKRSKRIYDKRVAFGFYCKKNNEKGYKEYTRDGVKALVVKNIFKIYLDENNKVSKPQEIIEKLKERIERDKGEKSAQYLKYKDIVDNLANKDIADIISRPIYAGIQTKSLDYKYKDFKILYDKRELEVDVQYFHKCINVKRIISPRQWIKAIEKWTSSEMINKRKRSPSKVKSNLFTGVFYCEKCNTDVELKGDTFVCGEKGCFKMKRERFINGILDHFVVHTVNSDKGEIIIKEATSKFRASLKSLQNELVKCINEQGEWISKYIKDSENKQIKERIQNLVSKKSEIEQEIEYTKEKITFIEGDFNNIILALANSKFISLLSEELENNEQALLEIVDYKDLKEITLDGKKIKSKNS